MLLSFAVSPVSSALILAQAATAQKGNPLLETLPTFFFMAVIFYFLLIRPQQKRAKDQAKLISSIRSGDEVVVNGMHGIVANPRDAESKTALVKFGENAKIEVDKSAITTVVKAESNKPVATVKA